MTLEISQGVYFDMMDNRFKGQRVRLRAVEVEDWEYFYQLDDSTTEYGRLTDEVWFPSSKESAKAWTEAQAKAKSDQDEFRFQIEAVEIGVLVGTLNTHTTNPRVGTFMYGIAITVAHQGKGYGSEAVHLLLRYFFNERRYQKVNAEVYSFNTPSIRFHERLGFTLEGRLRRMVYTGGQFHDALLYGMTREEFEGLAPFT
jgi:RimJ/RimL family protein N-acetyltransferase